MPRAVASFMPDAEAWLLDRRLWILASMCVLCPLAFLRRLDSLKFTSYVALCAVANLVRTSVHGVNSAAAHASPVLPRRSLS